MLQRHGGHSLTCINDGSFQLPDNVRSIVMPERVAALPNYLPKLWGWSRQLHNIIGERFASIDLDVVIAGNLAPILQNGQKLHIWNHARLEHYNTSLFAIEPGYGTQVWDRLTPADLQRARQSAAYWTGDQSWIGYVLGRGCSTFGEAEGVIQYRPKFHRQTMPPGMIAAFLCGPYEPFSEAEKCPWLKTLYR